MNESENGPENRPENRPDVRVRWAPGVRMTVCVGALLPVLIGLGVWQLERAAEKQEREALFAARAGAMPMAPPANLGGAAETDYLRLRLVGEFDPRRYFLVDNQVRGGRPGYWVVAGFTGVDGRGWLVNRGWIAAPDRRDRLPDVPIPAGRVSTVGVVWPDTGMVPLLADDDWQGPWPIRVQRLNVARMAQLLENAAPREVRLDPGQPGALAALPAQTRIGADRHRGYALQWFGLALALAVGYGIYGTTRSSRDA